MLILASQLLFQLQGRSAAMQGILGNVAGCFGRGNFDGYCVQRCLSVISFRHFIGEASRVQLLPSAFRMRCGSALWFDARIGVFGRSFLRKFYSTGLGQGRGLRQVGFGSSDTLNDGFVIQCVDAARNKWRFRKWRSAFRAFCRRVPRRPRRRPFRPRRRPIFRRPGRFGRRPPRLLRAIPGSGGWLVGIGSRAMPFPVVFVRIFAWRFGGRATPVSWWLLCFVVLSTLRYCWSRGFRGGMSLKIQK